MNRTVAAKRIGHAGVRCVCLGGRLPTCDLEVFKQCACFVLEVCLLRSFDDLFKPGASFRHLADSGQPNAEVVLNLSAAWSPSEGES